MWLVTRLQKRSSLLASLHVVKVFPISFDFLRGSDSYLADVLKKTRLIFEAI